MSIRREEVLISLVLDTESAKVHRNAILTLMEGQEPTMWPGDTLRCSYRLQCHYYGDVVRNLEAVNELVADPDVIVSGSIEELIHGRSLIYEVLGQLDRLIRQEAER